MTDNWKSDGFSDELAQLRQERDELKEDIDRLGETNAKYARLAETAEARVKELEEKLEKKVAANLRGAQLAVETARNSNVQKPTASG